jgi:hypothetical protein
MAIERISVYDIEGFLAFSTSTAVVTLRSSDVGGDRLNIGQGNEVYSKKNRRACA